MALQKTNATKAAFREEPNFLDPVTFTDSDVVPYTSLSWKPETDKIERTYINSKTLVAGKPLQGKQTASGTIGLELLPDAVDTTKLVGHVLYITALGKYTANGATIDLTNNTITDNTDAADGDAGMYYFSDANEAIKSLGAKYVIGGVEANSVDIRGVLVSSLKLAFPTQGLVTSEFSLSGSTGFIPVDQGSDLADFCSSMTPHVARNMTVTIDGVSVCATDLEFTITNEIADYICVTQAGVGEKSITKRTIEGSFKVAFENLDQINAYNAWSEATVFAYSKTLDDNEVAIELPKVQRTSLDLADDSGIFAQTVTFSAIDDCANNNRPIKLAAK